MNVPRAVVIASLVSGLAAQNRVWHLTAPAVGPFGELVAVIGDRDGDGHADVVRDVWFPLPSYGSWLFAHAWTFSGRTGQLLTAGPIGASVLFTAGDVNDDGCGDYIITAP
ncbi:MAG TPA: hypothetical protein VFT55_10155, partial [Planctomycetota bacterium]|nr:hypothetical protein [Planctomycetota bacterium]